MLWAKDAPPEETGGRDPIMPARLPLLATVERPAPQVPCGAPVVFWAKDALPEETAGRDPVMPAWLPPLHDDARVLTNPADERPAGPWVSNRARDALGRAGVPKKLPEPRVPLCHIAGLWWLPKPPPPAKLFA